MRQPTPFEQMPRTARVYIVAVIFAAVALLVTGLPSATFNRPLAFLGFLLLSSTAALLKVQIPLTASGSTMSVSYIADFASLLFLGPHETMVVATGGVLCQCLINGKERNPLHRTLFSVASLIITVEGAGAAFRALGGSFNAMPLVATPVPLFGAAATYFLLNSGLIASAIALSTRNAIVKTWYGNFLWSAPSYFVGAASVALAESLVARFGLWVAPVTLAPLFVTYQTYMLYMRRIERRVRQSSDLHLATLEALTRAIDAKDQVTQLHPPRLPAYAVALARAAGIPESQIEGIHTAALLHDIGKLAVPEPILSKPGPLTPEEFQKIRIHPQVGAEIIATVPFPYPVAPMVLGHHERWDGKGYPNGLAGIDIPLGARILAVADCYDAVTSERPYQRALPHESAIALLHREAGHALDPELVNLFVDVVPALLAQFKAAGLKNVDAADTGAATVDAAAPRGATTITGSVFENIALAHREIYALYDLAQTMGTSLGMGDTMTLISSKLSTIVPWSGCALFLNQGEPNTLKCRYSAGLTDRGSPALLNTQVKIHSNAFGWTAGNRHAAIDTTAFLGLGASTSHVPFASVIVCPLHFNDEFLGCLALYHADTSYYTEDHRRLLERIADQAGAAIHNSILFEQMQEDSLTDPLTGLQNRRSMFAHLSRELARAERLKSEVALIVMDVDGFKGINDTFGHNAGDRALREVAATLRGALRPYDMCVRYAGDEFIILLGDCRPEGAETKRRDLQNRINEIKLELRPGTWVTLRASAGVAMYPHDGTNYESLLAAADQRMYRDKAVRRGRTLVARSTNEHEPLPFPAVAAG
jgi:diguanylate cyclase (GGDEF)-like protein